MGRCRLLWILATALVGCESSQPPADDSPPAAGRPSAVPIDAGRPVDAGRRSFDGGGWDSIAAGECASQLLAHCTCDDGRSGMRECAAGLPFGPCRCEGEPPIDDACRPGASTACPCPDDATGFQVCHPSRELGPCVCPAIDCAGMDSDAGCEPTPRCDDAASFDGVCPGDPVERGLEPFDDALYLVGTLSEGSCFDVVLQPFWPELSPKIYVGLDCRHSEYTFAPGDRGLFMIDPFEGLRQEDEMDSAWIWPTPPCNARLSAYRFFDDGRELTYAYQCGRTLHLPDGRVVAEDVEELVLALSDYRLVVSRWHTTGRALSVINLDGRELSAFAPGETLGGTWTVVRQAATGAGAIGFVLLQWARDDGVRELVVYRVDADSAFQPLRRIAHPTVGRAHVVLPDGTVFSWELDPDARIDERALVWLRDGTQHVAWSEREARDVRAHGSAQMLIGPIDPEGPSIVELDWP